MKKGILIIFITILLSIVSSQVFAVPTLQFYIEGSTYDPVTESWTIVNADSFKLWVLGDVGHYGTISDVKLAAAFSSSESGTITIKPTTATSGLLPAPGDPSAPGDSSILLPIFESGADTPPLMGDGNTLPNHGEYGTGISWNTYALGNFTLTDSLIGDFTNSVPSNFPSTGQINAYLIDIDGYSTVHFDAFDHIIGNNKAKYKFAPFSHDSSTTAIPVPEPSTLILIGQGLIGIGLYGWRRKKG